MAAMAVRAVRVALVVPFAAAFGWALGFSQAAVAAASVSSLLQVNAAERMVQASTATTTTGIAVTLCLALAVSSASAPSRQHGSWRVRRLVSIGIILLAQCVVEWLLGALGGSARWDALLPLICVELAFTALVAAIAAWVRRPLVTFIAALAVCAVPYVVSFASARMATSSPYTQAANVRTETITVAYGRTRVHPPHAADGLADILFVSPIPSVASLTGWATPGGLAIGGRYVLMAVPRSPSVLASGPLRGMPVWLLQVSLDMAAAVIGVAALRTRAWRAPGRW